MLNENQRLAIKAKLRLMAAERDYLEKGDLGTARIFEKAAGEALAFAIKLENPEAELTLDEAAWLRNLQKLG